MRSYIYYILLTILLYFSISAKARFATIDDAAVEILADNVDMEVNKDGTNEAVIEMRAKILKEPGRNFAANYTLVYNEDSVKIKILEAKTIYNGAEYKLTPDMMEDKPLASSHQGFDQQRQILLSFPKAEIGAEIYLKYRRKEIKSILDNFYNDFFTFGQGGYLKAARLSVKSQMPLYVNINDPENVFEITKDENKVGELRNFTATLKKPICNDIISEAENSTPDRHYLTWISFSSLKDWKVLSKRFATGYEAVAKQEMPELLTSIIKTTKDIKDEQEQINAVTSLLNEKIQYMGDWRSVAGRYFPRNLSVIASSHVGDCKDFSIMTVIILNALGHNSHPALVLRGEGLRTFDDDLPSIGVFNHAFVKVKTKSGATYWIDPTNSRSMSDGVFPDIAGKMALVLDTKNPVYERVAEIDPAHSSVMLNKKFIIENDSVINDGELILKGESALMLSGASLYLSPKEIGDNLFASMSDMQLDEKDKLAMNLPDLTSRIVKDVKVGFKYRHGSQLFKTNLAPALKISSGWVDSLAAASSDQISDLVIGTQSTILRKSVIEGIKVKKIEDLNYSKTTPWLDVERSCKQVGQDTEINDKVIIKTMFIPKKDLDSEEYKNLRQDLLQHFKNSAVILAE